MKLIKNKKSQVGVMTFGQIVKWIILFALLLFVLFWFSGLGGKILNIVKSLF